MPNPKTKAKKTKEALDYIDKIQAQFPRLQIFQLSLADGYVVIGKFGVLPLKEMETICKICSQETDIEIDGVCEDCLEELEEQIEEL